MAKKKSKARPKKRVKSKQQRRNNTRPVNQARENAESQRAIKTLVIGAITIALLIAFVSFKWDGQSAYDRLVGGDAAEQGSAAR